MKKPTSGVAPEPAQTAPAVAADAGLEVTTFVSDVSQRVFARMLAPYADQPVPVSRDMEELWGAHGLRIISVPIADAPGLVRALQTGGGSQRQWLGQAYTWTEAARGPDLSAGSVVALDAERIRLSAGPLRLLVRSWVEPIPPESRVGVVSEGDAKSSASSAVLRVEMVPQHRETHPDTSRDNPLRIDEPRITAESQGLLFSRLYARMNVHPGRAILIVAERPGADWRAMAQQPEPPPTSVFRTPRADKPLPASATPASDNPWPKRSADSGTSAARSSDEWATVRSKATSEEPADSSVPAAPPPLAADLPARAVPANPSGVPRLGEVVRGPIPLPSARETARASIDSSEAGPSQLRVPTLGEAMLNCFPPQDELGAKSRVVASTQRTVVLFIPRVPSEVHLLTPTSEPRRGTSSAGE